MKINKNWLAAGAGILVVAVVGLAVGLNQGNLFTGSLGGVQPSSSSSKPALIKTSIPSISCSGTPNPALTGANNKVTWTAKLYNIPTTIAPVLVWQVDNSLNYITASSMKTHYNAGETKGKIYLNVKYYEASSSDPSIAIPHELNTSCSVTLTDPILSAVPIAQPSLQIALNVSCKILNPTPMAGETVVFTGKVIGGTAPYTIKWSGKGIDGQTGVNATTTYANVDAGNQTATLTITDAANTTKSGQCSVNVQEKPEAQPVVVVPPQQPVQPVQPVAPSQPAVPVKPATTATSGNCAGFTDLSVKDSNCAAITFAKEIGAMTGNPNGSFGAEGLIQRDQVAKIALETFKLYDDQQSYCQGGVSGFPDVSLSAWSFQYICRAKALGVITGYQSGEDAGYFRPSRFLNRAEFLAIILRNLQEEFPKGTSYADVSSNDWYSAYARFSYNNNLYTGDALFPNMTVTRREAAAILFKLHQLGKI